MNDYLKLCLLTHLQSMTLTQYEAFILHAVEGGVTSVQLREKSLDKQQLYDMACMLKNILSPLNIPLIINDDVELAKKINADGVHLGQSDLSPQAARDILGPDKIIGWSIETRDELVKANQLSCINYVAASAVFASKTKMNCKTLWGLSGLRELSQASKHPVIAIGGIEACNIQNVIRHGAKGAAIINALHAHAHPAQAANELVKLIDEARRNPCV